MKKIFWSIVGTFVVLVLIAVAIVALNLDRIVKTSIEIYGPKITKVSVTLDAVHIGLLTGSASVKGLVVGNPPGYKSSQAISVGKISVGVNPASILSQKIVVRSIKVESPEITFEGGLSGNNLSTIKDNASGSAQTGTATVVTNSVGKTKPAKKLEVDDLEITGAKVSGSFTLFGGKEIPINNLPLPPIHLMNLGTGPDGITASDLTKRVLDSITVATVQEITKYGTDIGKSATNLGGKGVDQIKKGIGSLFGK